MWYLSFMYLNRNILIIELKCVQALFLFGLLDVMDEQTCTTEQNIHFLQDFKAIWMSFTMTLKKKDLNMIRIVAETFALILRMHACRQ